MLILAFLLPHPLATEVFQKKEERVINATQLSLILSQESPGVLWPPVLGVNITCMQVCAVPQVSTCRLADNHIVPFLTNFKIMKCISKILAAE